mgnify:FL=1
MCCRPASPTILVPMRERRLTATIDLALPASCAGCGLEGRSLCASCVTDLDVRLSRPPGVPIGLPSPAPAPLLQLEWCAPYSGAVRRAIHALKYRGERRLAEPFGGAVARRWRAAGVGGDVLVPVPADAERGRARGYDQARLIAAVAARQLNLPAADLVVRTRATVAQFDLDRTARFGNLGDAFAADPTAAGLAAATLRRAWIILVDDVVTTGATLAGCAAALLDAGALGVSAITVARER